MWSMKAEENMMTSKMKNPPITAKDLENGKDLDLEKCCWVCGRTEEQVKAKGFDDEQIMVQLKGPNFCEHTVCCVCKDIISNIANEWTEGLVLECDLEKQVIAIIKSWFAKLAKIRELHLEHLLLDENLKESDR